MEVSNLQANIKQLAEDLGSMNLSLNSVLEDNDKLRKQNQQLKNRIKKKKVVIEQQYKDKTIIHSKLIAAERKKEQYQIKMTINQKNQQLKQIPQKKTIPQPKKQIKQDVIQQYKNTGKGSYQPPNLFLEGDKKEEEKSDEEDEEDVNAQELLSKIRQNFQTDKGDNQDD